ncbi:MAG: hypothetical protein HY529_01990 [Chloroflexi bacterium]|nr:hypothetical protein [Chloroflexota bacterium]
MPDVPPDVAIKATIRPGSVYYFQLESFSSPYPHYFIVVNIDPLSEQTIILVSASSQIATVKKRRQNCPPETLVQIMPKQYPDFPYPSIVDCNHYHEETLEKLIERLSTKRLQLKTEMDMLLVKQLRQGLLASRLIPGRIKMQLQPADL